MLKTHLKSWQCTFVERISWKEFINSFLTHWHSLALNFIGPASVVAVTFDDQVEICIKGHMVWFTIVQCFQRLIKIHKGFSCTKCHTCYLQAFLNQFCNCIWPENSWDITSKLSFWSSDNLELLSFFSCFYYDLGTMNSNIEIRVLMLLKALVEFFMQNFNLCNSTVLQLVLKI